MENDEKNIWSIQQIHNLINFVRNRSIIYDKKHPEYKIKGIKNAAWKEIADAMESKTLTECKNKWNTLRIQQRRIVCQESRKKGGRKNERIQWHCYNLLQFLIPHMEWNVLTEDFQKTDYSEDEQQFDDCIVYTGQQQCEEKCINVEGNDLQISNTTNQQHELIIHENVVPSATVDIPSANVSLIQNKTDLGQISEALEEHIRLPSSTKYRCSYNTDSTQIVNSIETQTQPLPVSIAVVQTSEQQQQPTPSSPQVQHILQQQHQPNLLNYFLMDVQLQMEKLNELAKMELKIEIQKLLLEKLRCSENLRTNY